MTYSIWIVNSWGKIQGHTRCFEEIAVALQAAFRVLGHEVPIVHLPEEATGTVIVLGAGVLHRISVPLPSDMIIYNFEQVHDEGRFFAPLHPYKELLRRWPVWDYSMKNIEALRTYGIHDVTWCGIGYMPELTRIRPASHEDIDVLFIGSPHERRQNILDVLKDRGLHVHVIQDQYGPPRDAMIARSKIVLNIHAQSAGIFEIVRVSYLLANRKCVISEPGADEQLEEPLREAVVFAPYERLVETCMEYVSDHNKRKQREEAGLRIFSQISQVPMLEAALEQSQIKNKNAGRIPDLPRIFVSIASFRDPETQATVDDLFKAAAHPERIHVGICLQVDPKEDAACMVRLDGYPGKMRITQVHHKDSHGANWARAQAFALCEGEDYVLAIDSHMRFESGWDEALIAMLERCPPRSLLSTYIPRYTPPNNRDSFPGQILRIRVYGMAEEGNPQMLHLTKVPVSLNDKERSGLYRSPFCLAGFIFTRSATLAQVPFDPYIRFWGDEITTAARLWTHGYDIYQPDKVVLYHYWRRDDLVPIQPYRNMNTPESRRSYARIRHLLGFTPAQDKEALAEIDKYGLGTKRRLEDLWTFAGIDWQSRTVSKDALEGRWNILPATGNWDPAKKTKEKMDRIFVNIASYRDAECQWTVKDLFEKAAHPERVFVGLCWQYDPEEDKHCFEVPAPRPDQVRLLPVNWRDAEGVCWARHQVQQLWEGEEYTLMIDSHMRFVPGWDDLMIEELAACDSKKPVLSCSPPPYTPPNNLSKNMNPTVRRVKPFMADGNIRCQGEMLDRAPEHPLRGAFVVANFVFSRAEIIREVSYDPYLYFDQEEITYAARLYTHGWDVFSTRRQFLYHFYNDPKTSVRPLHWSDMSKAGKDDNDRIRYLYARGLARFNHLTGYKFSTDPDVIRDLDKYGFGRVRTLGQFEAFTGVDFKHKTASERALRGGFIEDLAKYRDKPFFVPEIDKRPDPLPVAATPKASALSVGDFIPMFDTVDDGGHPRALEIYGGRHCLMFFIPALDVSYASQLMQALQRLIPREMHEKIWIIYLFSAPVEQLKAIKQQLGTAHGLWADPGGSIGQAFGVTGPAGFLINQNLKILRRYDLMPPDALASHIVADGQKALEEYRFKNRVPRTIAELPPALIVPNAFTPELCEKCIAAFRTGHSFEGTVGAEEKLTYSPKAKIRTDHIVQSPLLEEIDDKLSRSLFPEIRKVFGFEVTHRELYKVGLYTGEKKGFFQRHRDNFEPPLGYRRVAMTLHLNNDYEGGGLHFPEYDDNIYRPAAGSAIAFSCATLHEARPVTRGERFVLVGFFHGDQDEAYRRHYLAEKGSPLKTKDYTPTLPPDPPIRQGRDFYRNWRRKHVRFDGQNKK